LPLNTAEYKRCRWTKGLGDIINGGVDKMADFIEIHTTFPKEGKFEIAQVQGRDDIRESVQIARQRLGENAYDVDKRMSWWKIAPNGDYVLKHDGVIVGYFSLQAIKPEAIENIFNKGGFAEIL
jgi:hypothetical protein